MTDLMLGYIIGAGVMWVVNMVVFALVLRSVDHGATKDDPE